MDNAEYGFFALLSTGTRFAHNVARGSDEAGMYVGDSPDANALVVGNDVADNLFGIFVRSAQGAKLVLNDAHENCAGIFLLADAPGPVGNVSIVGNVVRDNDRACPAGEEAPPLSGIGIALLGATTSAWPGTSCSGTGREGRAS